MRRFTQEEDKFIKENYPHKGLKYCADKLDRLRGSIQQRVHTLMLPKLTKEVKNTLIKPRIVKIDDIQSVDVRQFLKIDTPEVAYILGLLWADGYVHYKGKISIGCLKTDALKYMDTFLKTGEWKFFDKIYERYGVKCKESRTIYCSNTRISNYLQKMDYKSKSTASACKILETIPDNLKHYFFRGLIDGDGYISYNKDNNLCWIKITSNYNQNWTYTENLCKKLGIKYNIHRDKYKNKENKINSRSVFSITNAFGVKTFGEYIFKNIDSDKIGLNRKYDKFTEIMEIMKTRPRLKHLF